MSAAAASWGAVFVVAAVLYFAMLALHAACGNWGYSRFQQLAITIAGIAATVMLASVPALFAAIVAPAFGVAVFWVVGLAWTWWNWHSLFHPRR